MVDQRASALLSLEYVINIRFAKIDRGQESRASIGIPSMIVVVEIEGGRVDGYGRRPSDRRERAFTSSTHTRSVLRIELE